MKKAMMLLLPFLFFTSCPNSPDDASEPSGLGGLKDPITHNMSAAEYISVKGLNAGWNLGNTYDTVFNPRFSAGHYDILFQRVKAAGFNIIRIPVTWSSHFDTDTYEVTESFLNELEPAVIAAHDAGLVAIINTHHDVRNTGRIFSLSESGASYLADGENGTEFLWYLNRFTELWRQIAERFRDYGDWLMFEPLNEPAISINNATSWDYAPSEYYEVINRWNQAFVDTVRESGGNNAKRYLLFCSYGAKLKLSLDPTYKIPADPAGPGKLIYTFHSYVPQQLALEGGNHNWNSATVSVFTVPFESAYENFIMKGIPVIMGETGATFHSQRSGTDSQTANRNRLLLLNSLGHEARKMGIIPCLWDNGEATRDPTRTQPNGETFALFRRKDAHDNDTANWGKPIDHTMINGGRSSASTGGAAMAAGNAAADDPDFGRVTIEAFIDAINGRSSQWKTQDGMPASLSRYFVD